MRKRWLKIGHLILLILLALPFVFVSCEHVRGRVSLALYRHSLIAKGEKLTARDLASPPTQGENGAPRGIAGSKGVEGGRGPAETLPTEDEVDSVWPGSRLLSGGGLVRG